MPSGAPAAAAAVLFRTLWGALAAALPRTSPGVLAVLPGTTSGAHVAALSRTIPDALVAAALAPSQTAQGTGADAMPTTSAEK